MSTDDDSLDQTGQDSSSTEMTQKPTPSDRRQFVVGVASALGVGALVQGASGHGAEAAKTGEVRGRIVSRIQDELKRSQSELLHNYDRPDGAGSHGRYNKP